MPLVAFELPQHRSVSFSIKQLFSLKRESSRAIAQPVTPPPIMAIVDIIILPKKVTQIQGVFYTKTQSMPDDELVCLRHIPLPELRIRRTWAKPASSTQKILRSFLGLSFAFG